MSLCIYTKAGDKLAVVSTLNGDLLKNVHRGDVACRAAIADFNLNPGKYVLVICIHDGKDYLLRSSVKEFTVDAPNKATWEFVDFKYEYFVDSPKSQQIRKSFL